MSLMADLRVEAPLAEHNDQITSPAAEGHLKGRIDVVEGSAQAADSIPGHGPLPL